MGGHRFLIDCNHGVFEGDMHRLLNDVVAAAAAGGSVKAVTTTKGIMAVFMERDDAHAPATLAEVTASLNLALVRMEAQSKRIDGLCRSQEALEKGFDSMRKDYGTRLENLECAPRISTVRNGLTEAARSRHSLNKRVTAIERGEAHPSLLNKFALGQTVREQLEDKVRHLSGQIAVLRNKGNERFEELEDGAAIAKGRLDAQTTLIEALQGVVRGHSDRLGRLDGEGNEAEISDAELNRGNAAFHMSRLKNEWRNYLEVVISEKEHPGHFQAWVVEELAKIYANWPLPQKTKPHHCQADGDDECGVPCDVGCPKHEADRDLEADVRDLQATLDHYQGARGHHFRVHLTAAIRALKGGQA